MLPDPLIRRFSLSSICGLLALTAGLPISADAQTQEQIERQRMQEQIDALMPTGRTQEQLWIANGNSHDIHIYEIDTWRLLRVQFVGEDLHGIIASRDQRTAYVGVENRRTSRIGKIVSIDTRTGLVTHRLRLDSRPGEGAITPDGRYLYVPDGDGGMWWVIATAVRGREPHVVKRIVTGGGFGHNTMTDGRYMYLAPLRQSYTYIVDPLLGHQVVGYIDMDEGLCTPGEHCAGRPFDVSADGRRLYQAVDGMIGFKVVDLESRKVIREVHHRDAVRDPLVSSSRSHGLAIRPDQEEVWSTYVRGGQVSIHERSSGEYREIALLQMPGDAPQPYWITFSPDSRYAYVSQPNESRVVVVDAHTKEIVTILEAGPGAKRTMTILVPLDDSPLAGEQ